MFDPVADVEQRYPEYEIVRWPLTPAKSALLRRHRRILTDDQLDADGHRCGVTHELIHLDRGDQCGGDSVLDARREAAVDRAAAEKLIPYERLRVVIQVDQDEHQHAQELGVDIETFLCRIRHTLTDAQRAELVALTRARDAGVA